MAHSFLVLAQVPGSQPAAADSAPAAHPNTVSTATGTTTGAPGSAGHVDAPWYANSNNTFFLLMGAILLMYLVMSKSKKNEDKERTDALSKLKQGDRVQTIGGIIGNVVRADENEVLVKVDEGANVKVRFSRSAIHRVLTDDKAETK